MKKRVVTLISDEPTYIPEHKKERKKRGNEKRKGERKKEKRKEEKKKNGVCVCMYAHLHL
jgi:hypothetical protein